MPTLEEAKSFLKVDFDTDDALIRTFIKAAREYVKNATGRYDSKSPLHKTAALYIVSEAYTKREYTTNVKSAANASRLVQSILLQIKTESGDDE